MIRSTILIARIRRVIETQGAVGDGAKLAGDYAEAVRRANERMEAAEAAVAAGQISEAIRVMEESPRLVDEVSDLDFNQQLDWEAVCANNGWTQPAKLDKTLMARMLERKDSQMAVEPYMKMYRKSCLTNNNELALMSLRRLVELDHSQDWRKSLVDAEAIARKELLKKFNAAKEASDLEEAERLALELLDESWTELPAPKGIEDVRMFVQDREAARRSEEASEDVGVLEKCRFINWNRPLVRAMLTALDELISKGWSPRTDERATIDACRQRIADEEAAEAREQQWIAARDYLAESVRTRNVVNIRAAFRSPSFEMREPPSELVDEAKKIIVADELRRRNKRRTMAVCAVVAVLVVVGIVAVTAKKRLFSARCEETAAVLASIQKGSNAIAKLADALEKVKTSDPAVFADSRVSAYVSRLETMRRAEKQRVSDLRSKLTVMTLMKEDWTAVSEERFESVKGQVEDLILRGDAETDDEARKLFHDLCGDRVARLEQAAANRKRTAAQSHEQLLSDMKELTLSLKSGPVKVNPGAVAKLKSDAIAWRRKFNDATPGMLVELSAAVADMESAEKEQNSLLAAVDALASATDVSAILAEHTALRGVLATTGYNFQRDVKPIPYTAEDVEQAMELKTHSHRAFASLMSSGVDQNKYDGFLRYFSRIPDSHAFYSFYGLCPEGSDRCKAVSMGEPTLIPKPSGLAVAKCPRGGQIFDFNSRSVQTSVECTSRSSKKPMKSTVELRKLFDDFSRSNKSVDAVEKLILSQIDRHMKEAHQSSYIQSETEAANSIHLAISRYPAIRRVKMLSLYFVWLQDMLHLMPDDAVVIEYVSQVKKLGMNITLDQYSSDFSWTRMESDEVRRRNKDCLALLKKMPVNWVELYRKGKADKAALSAAGRWRIEHAGVIRFDPYSDVWQNDHKVIIPSVLNSVTTDHPLYVMRKDGRDEPVLVRALVPGKTGKWAICSGMKSQFVLGEPLYQVVENGKPIDVRESLKTLLDRAPEHLVKPFRDNLPLFSKELPSPMEVPK